VINADLEAVVSVMPQVWRLEPPKFNTPEETEVEVKGR